jgi:16S rRNA processing protein RimM
LKTEDRSDTVLIGRIGSPSGLRGEVRITLYAQDSGNLKEGKVLLLNHAPKGPMRSETSDMSVRSDAAEIKAKIEHVRYQKDKPVVKLEGFDDRTAVEALRGLEVSIEADDLEELPEGEHYVRNLIGCRVVDLAGGTEVGILRDVIQNTAQSVLDVETPEGRRVLIPAVDAFMRSIDEAGRLIEVELIPGFLD